MFQLLIVWPFVDIPTAIFEFAASTAIFLVKLVHKPFQVIWAIIGVVREIRGLLGTVKVAGTWPSFVEADSTVPFSRLVYEFHTVMSVGVGLSLLTFGSTSEALYNGPIAPIFRPIAITIIAVVFAVLLGLIPFLYSLYLFWDTRKSSFTFLRAKSVIGLFSSFCCFIGLLLIGFLVYSWDGVIPGVFLIRAFPILISSFVFGPGVAWLTGIVLCEPDDENPTFMIGPLRWLAPVVVVGGGYFFLAAAVFFTVPFAYSQFPVETASTWIPTGDGAATVVVPFQVCICLKIRFMI